VFIDISCPWCLIGVTRLERTIENLRGEIAVFVRYRPYLLDPNAPPDGTNIHEKIRQKYGMEPKALFQRVEDEARATGVAWNLSAVPLAYQTIPAHILIQKALAKNTQQALVRDLLHGYFLEGKNIGDTSSLIEIGKAHGFAPGEVETAISDPAERKAILEAA